MKTAKEYSDTAKREVSVDVDALLAATSDNDDENLEDIGYSEKSETRKLIEKHTWRELADAFELDIHDFSVSEVNR